MNKGQKIAIMAGIVVALLASAAFISYSEVTPPADTTQRLPSEAVTRNSVSSFAWSYEESGTNNMDGNPNTDVFLTATYGNGAMEKKLIDTVHSSCNELPDTDMDSVEGTTNIQCYGAGLGYRFKITEGEGSYLVQRQTFEEGTLEFEPTPSEYEVVAEFPLTN